MNDNEAVWARVRQNVFSVVLFLVVVVVVVGRVTTLNKKQHQVYKTR